MSANNITMNATNCSACICRMVQSSTIAPAILSLNCYTKSTTEVTCTLFTNETRPSPIDYHVETNIESMFYFQWLPPVMPTSSTAFSTTRPRSWIFGKITRAGDPIVGLYNTTAGTSTGAKNGRYSGPSEEPPFAIDGSTATKYLNFGGTGGFHRTVSAPGVSTGFYVTPNISDVSIATAIQFATANDYSNRDPITITLEGTNATSLDLGSSWTLIYNGSTGINASIAPSRNTYMCPQNFSNTKAFRSYRLLVTSQRNAECAVQYSEAQIIGYYYV